MSAIGSRNRDEISKFPHAQLCRRGSASPTFRGIVVTARMMKACIAAS
jgi:hypothetical protein